MYYNQHSPQDKIMMKLYKTTQDNLRLQQILESHLGGLLILEKHAKSIEGYDEINLNKTNTMVKQASEILFAYIYT